MSERSRPVAELYAVDEHKHGLVVRFYWIGDRYGHSIEAISPAGARVLMESIEGGVQDNWPASPTLQNINLSSVQSDSEHGRVAMLVGAAGNSHWSMCISARDRWDGACDDHINRTELVFDVACRLNELPPWLGSSYRALAGQVAISEALQVAYVPVDLPACVVNPESAQLKLDTTSDAFPVIRCDATCTAMESFPTTIRWKYAVGLAR